MTTQTEHQPMSDEITTDRTPPAAPGTDQAPQVAALLEGVAHLRVRRAARDQRWVLLGALLMVAGVVTGVVAYVKSSTTDNPLVQNDAQVLAVIGLTAALVGGIVFLRYSLTEFLRFWLARALVADGDRR